MGPARGAMVAVDLVEADEVDAARSRPPVVDPEAGRPAGGRGSRRPQTGRHAPRDPGRTRRRRRAALGALVVAAVVAGTGELVSAERESARLERLGEVPGVLDLVDAPLTEVWRSPERLWSPLWDVGGLLVGVAGQDERTPDVVVVGLDQRTGATAWTTVVVPDTRTAIGGVSCVVPDAPSGGDDADRLVVCVSIDEVGPNPQDLSLFEPRRARLLLLDPATGTVLEERVVDPSTSITALGPDLVVKQVLDDGRVEISRTDPRAGDVRWTFTGPPSASRPEYTYVRTDDELVLVPGESGWVLSADGDVVHAWAGERPAAGNSAGAVRGRVLVQPSRDLLGSTAFTDLRTGRSFRSDGYAPNLATDDGSTGDLVLVQSAQGEGLVAHDAASGRPVWAVPGEDAGGALVLDGRVVRAAPDRLQAVEARTGEVLWSVPSGAGRPYGLQTDGRVVLRTERETARDVVLVARGLDDGRVRWTSDVTDDLNWFVEVSGRLYGVTSDGTVAFGSSGG